MSLLMRRAIPSGLPRVYNATCLTSMCVQSDKPTRMLFIYNSSPVAARKHRFPLSHPTKPKSAPRNAKRIFFFFLQTENKRHIVSTDDNVIPGAHGLVTGYSTQRRGGFE